MGFIEFGILCIVVIVLAAVICWVLDSFAPNHPPLANKIVWGVALLIIVYTLAQAVGLLGRDVRIPSL